MNPDYTNSQESKFQHKKPKNLNGNEQDKSMNLKLNESKTENWREEVALRLEEHI